jgi:uncharacterized protein YkwD
MKKVLTMMIVLAAMGCGSEKKKTVTQSPTQQNVQPFAPSEPQKVEITVKQEQPAPVASQGTKSEPPKSDEQPQDQPPACEPQEPACGGQPVQLPPLQAGGLPPIYGNPMGGYGGPIIVTGPVIQPMPCYKVDPAICEIENNLADMINGYRAARGINPAAPNFQISYAARGWSHEMAARGGVALAPLRMIFDVAFGEFGPTLVIGQGLVGEAVAGATVGATPLLTAQALLQALIEHDVYNNAILSPAGFVGVGVVVDGAAAYVTVVTSL